MKQIRMPEKIEKISTKWTTVAPFFSEFTYRFYYYEMKKGEMEIPTMGVRVKKAKLELFYDKEFLKKTSLKELEFVLIHEIMHIISLHQARFLNLNPTKLEQLSNQLIWNVAADMIINQNIKDKMYIDGNKVEVPKWTVFLEQARKEGYQGKDITEELYEWLKKNSKQSTKTIVVVGDGNASPTDDHSFMDAEELSEVDKNFIKDVIKNAEARGWGTVSGGMVEEIKEAIRERGLNWKQLLRKYTKRWIDEKGPNKFRTWNKRNRRQLPLPGYKRPHNKVIVAVDTSGSIGQEEFKAFFREIETIVQDMQRMEVIQCDTDIKRVDYYKKGDYKKIKLTGRGGTSFQPVFDWLHERKKKDLLIYFTDLYASFDINTYGIPAIWCSTTEEEMPKKLGPTIHIKLEEEDG